MRPIIYTLNGRVSEHEDETDIELRSAGEKISIAENVDDRFAPLFIASPKLLIACKAMLRYCVGDYHPQSLAGIAQAMARDAVEEAGE